MTNPTQIKPCLVHSPEPWDCDAQTTMYSIEGDELTMTEVRANVTEAGWDTVAFIEAIWPGADANARRIVAAVNACKNISTEALERGVVAGLRAALGTLLDAAGDLDAAIDGATGQFDDERARLDAAIRSARAALDDGMEIDTHELLATRQQIALVWSVEDVQQVRPDLTEEQAWEVLRQVERRHDAEIGVTWLTLEWFAENLFGDAPETAAEAQP
jgi:hypothetical protein